eukprot:365321-Chlamydomonas_euryale.AAC.12
MQLRSSPRGPPGPRSTESAALVATAAATAAGPDNSATLQRCSVIMPRGNRVRLLKHSSRTRMPASELLCRALLALPQAPEASSRTHPVGMLHCVSPRATLQ